MVFFKKVPGTKLDLAFIGHLVASTGYKHTLAFRPILLYNISVDSDKKQITKIKMPDKLHSAGHDNEYKRFQPEYAKTAPQDLAKEMHDLGKSIDPANQMPKDNKEKINSLLQECKNGECQTEEVLKGNGYIPLKMSKFENAEDVHEGHIAYLYANNVLSEGRQVVVGKYRDGYAIYHKEA